MQPSPMAETENSPMRRLSMGDLWECLPPTKTRGALCVKVTCCTQGPTSGDTDDTQGKGGVAWQRTRRHGRSDDRFRRPEADALFLSDAVREPARHQSRGADRGGPCRLLH